MFVIVCRGMVCSGSVYFAVMLVDACLPRMRRNTLFNERLNLVLVKQRAYKWAHTKRSRTDDTLAV